MLQLVCVNNQFVVVNLILSVSLKHLIQYKQNVCLVGA